MQEIIKKKMNLTNTILTYFPRAVNFRKHAVVSFSTTTYQVKYWNDLYYIRDGHLDHCA